MSQLLFEFEDKKWFPEFLRRYMTDYLEFIFSRLNMYEPVLPMLNDILRQTENNVIVDTCSGSGGPLPGLKREYEKRYKTKIRVHLTDKFMPCTNKLDLPDGIIYEKTPLDADNIPHDVIGLRTMFSSLHHFSPLKIEKILLDAVTKNQPVAFFDGGNKGLSIILAIAILHPIGIFMFTPFIKPLSFRRLFFTYVIPLVVFFTVWDGMVSIYRLHNIEIFKHIVKQEKFSKYDWSIGSLLNKFGMKIVYISGISKN